MLPGQMSVPGNTLGIDTTGFVERVCDYMSKASHKNTRKQEFRDIYLRIILPGLMIVSATTLLKIF